MIADSTLGLEGAAAIPRSNGEPLFSAPWQSRAFGMAMTLSEQGAFEWEDFRARLIAEIADAARRGKPGGDRGWRRLALLLALARRAVGGARRAGNRRSA